MKKVALYSSSGRAAAAGGKAGQARGSGAAAPPGSPDPAAGGRATAAATGRGDGGGGGGGGPGRRPPSSPPPAGASGRRERLSLVLGGALLGLVLGGGWFLSRPAPGLTQQDIDAAVLHTLSTQSLPSPAIKAYERIRPSLVRVRGFASPDARGQQEQLGEGSGVVIVEGGLILTNLHVAAGAPRLKVVFADGTESDADLVSSQPENDLAVLKARVVPDDLKPATMASTAKLAVGTEVVAVGFPFGIGPTATSGIVSGLKREFRSPDDQQVLSNLIQFDAAANPGSSGGPLVTKEGEVVGIVTAILSPGNHGGFVGIGFAVPIENAASGVGMSPF
ncbi:S1C family serine protease [Caldimonas tepidiphila]|uniref:S1C family serine protease n=1 Tax=Caldimonas tepidiphila TaxID=2315841 RepID=UPI000E5B9028|nr:trypsin-like peptidase domain-containing protein [Caldimonas tepidiphila]